MERFRIEVGHQHDVKPGNIVGAIANEAGLDAQHIGHIDIHTDFSMVDLPSGMPNDVFQDLRKAWVCGQRLDISRLEKPGKKKKSEQKAKKEALLPCQSHESTSKSKDFHARAMRGQGSTARTTAVVMTTLRIRARD
jgi:hypothetical protein